MTLAKLLSKKLDLLLAVLVYTVFFILLAYAQAFADYRVTYLGRYTSDNEVLIDAASSGWAIINDANTNGNCFYRVNIFTREKLDLCSVGIKNAVAINDSGIVVGHKKARQLATWSPQTGLRTLKGLKGGFKVITPVDINNQGTVLAFAYGRDESDSTYYNEYPYSVDKNNSLKRIRVPKHFAKYGVRPIALNDRGTILLQSDAGLALKHKSGKFTRISGVYEDRSYGALSMNNRDQIASSAGSEHVYTPGQGWRLIATGSEGCDRCDTTKFSAMSESGKAVFYDSSYLTLSNYPLPNLGINCLLARNSQVINTQSVVAEFSPGSFENAHFLKGDKVLFSAEISGDASERQLFILEQSGSDSAIYNYCLEARVEVSEDARYNCDADDFTQATGCIARVEFETYGSKLPPIKIELMARQVVGYQEEDCHEVLVDTLELPFAGAGFNISTRIDPGFSYFFRSPDPRFTITGDWLAAGYYDVPSRVGPCRKPLEGLVGGQ